MNVLVGSMFRDSSAYIDRALDQYARLAKELDAKGDVCRFVFVENDSTDDTRDRLCAFDGDAEIIFRSDDCPYWPSTDHRERWRHLAWVANGVLESVEDEDDVVIYVESDLAWEPETMLRLLDHLNHVDVVSPMNMRIDGYYDLWGSRGMDGRRFAPYPPYHPDLADARTANRGLVEVQSVAGCTAMVADVARACRFSPDDCYVGFNRDIRLHGWKVWLDPSLEVLHG